MTGHVHAKLMAEYAKDALTSEAPFLEWEYYSETKGYWSQLGDHPCWGSDTQYRRKVKEVKLEAALIVSVAPKELNDTQYRLITKDGSFVVVPYAQQVCHSHYNKNTLFNSVEEAEYVAFTLNSMFSKRGG